MLLSRLSGAPSPCLPCQLRQAIFSSTPTPPACTPCFARRGVDTRRSVDTTRCFTASRPRADQDDNGVLKQDRKLAKRPYAYHYPLGRIVGEPGKRQRQQTQQLKIDTMGKNVEVIVMRDVQASQQKEQRKEVQRDPSARLALSAAQLENVVAQENQEPSEDEVTTSIDALRPDSNVLEAEYYESLLKRLRDGYNPQQLSSYLATALNLSAVKSDKVHIIPEHMIAKRKNRYQRTQWRSGRTPIERRPTIGSVVRKSERSNKPKLAQQILRLAWNLKIHSEEQQVGEMEMRLQAWEVVYLFDLRAPSSQTIMYQHCVDSPLLLRSSEIRPYRPRHAVRITARRQDAEEIADRLERCLHNLHSLKVDFDVFSPMLGQPGWPATIGKMFAAETLSEIERRTLTAIRRQSSKVLVIHGDGSKKLEDARRLLLMLLDIPHSGSSEVLVPHVNKKDGDGDPVLLPHATERALPFRHQRLQLCRLTAPARQISEHQAVFGNSKSYAPVLAPTELHRVLDKLRSMASKDSQFTRIAETKHWHASEALAWEVQFCKLLQASDPASKTEPDRPERRGKNKPKPPTSGLIERTQSPYVPVSLIPQFFSLLAYFRRWSRSAIFDAADSVDRTFLHAHFIPSPFTARGIGATAELPRIQFQYELVHKPVGGPDLKFYAVEAVLEERDLHIPLPDEAVDLRIVKRVRLRSKHYETTRQEDYQKFEDTLRQSLQDSATAALRGTAELKLHVPAALACSGLASSQANADTGDDVEAVYLFERFEQVRKNRLVPNDKANKITDSQAGKLFKSFGQHLKLRVHDVTGGVFGGKRMEVALHGYTGVNDGQLDLLLESAVGLVRLITRINNGEVLHPDRTPLGLPEPAKEHS